MQNNNTYLIASFPKSGRTWLKFILKFYFEVFFSTKDLELDKYRDWCKENSNIPKLEFIHDQTPHFVEPEDISLNNFEYEKYKIIFLVRDPKDIIVSLYFEMTKRRKFYIAWGHEEKIKHITSDISMSDFIRLDIGSMKTLIEYYKMWSEIVHRNKNIIITYYENLHLKPHEELRKVLDFMNVNFDMTNSENAFKKSEFNNMRNYEKNLVYKSMVITPGDVTDDESYKVRKGKIGGYKNYL
jgi:hypothetical protein